MPETNIAKLEKGRAEFAYKCAIKGKEISKPTQINGEWYEDDKYKSYVSKLPSMILSNGLGQTIAFVLSKRKKEKEGKPPGSNLNPKNAYDLIYLQLTDYLKSNSTTKIKMPDTEKELVNWIITQDTYNYRYITEEILAFLTWLKRFAEGMIEAEDGGD